MILVSGATGHLGNVLVRKLVSKGENVRALILPGETTHHLPETGVEIVEGDVLNQDSLKKAMNDVKTVYHLAGVISTVSGNEAIMERVNVEGTRNVVASALESGVERLIHTSSVHALKRAPEGEIMDENTPLDPNNPAGAYDQSKAKGTMEVYNGIEKGLNAVIVCPTGIIGPYASANSEMGKVIKSFARKKLHFIVDGSFDFVDVRDVADGLILAAEKGKTGEKYILGGENIEIKDILQMIQKETNVKAPYITLPSNIALFSARIGELICRFIKSAPSFTPYSLHTLFDNSNYSSNKAKKELGYRPRALRESISDTIKWHLNSLKVYNKSPIPLN